MHAFLFSFVTVSYTDFRRLSNAFNGQVGTLKNDISKLFDSVEKYGTCSFNLLNLSSLMLLFHYLFSFYALVVQVVKVVFWTSM